MNTSALLWFQRFLFVPSYVSLRFYPLFVHRVSSAKLAVDALLALGDG